VSRAEGDVRTLRAALARLLTLPPTTEFSTAEDDSIIPAPLASLEEALSAAEGRSDVASEESALRAAELEVRSRQGERLPRLIGSARYTGTAPERDFGDESRTYAAAVGFEWTAFRGGGIAAEIEASRASLVRIRSGRERLAAEVGQDVVSAWSERDTAQRELAAARAGLAAADEALRIVALRFREGRDTLSRYLEAERARTEAASLEVQARSAVSIAEARLHWATGLDTRLADASESGSR
jgi:outer membrane protein TolC